jgi:dTDP-4-dehydrorhamnose 3,5-epimerase
MNKFDPVQGIDGIWIRSLDLNFDDRGCFTEVLRINDLPEGVPNFVQDSISSSKKNVLRGMHIQLEQWQLITLLEGTIVDVLLNLERKSDSYLKSTSFNLSWETLNQVLVAPGFAHGFAVISDNARIQYKSSIYYGSTEQFGVRWNSGEIFDYWPRKDWKVSERDSNFPIPDDL